MSEYSRQIVREREAAEPALVAALAAEGFRLDSVLVVRFLDTNEGARWFYRQHEELGYIVTPFDGCVPRDRQDLHAYAVREFGADCALIY
jgi:hypothetical protein